MADPTDPTDLTAARFVERLSALATDEQREKYRRYFTFGDDEQFVGVAMGQVFKLAKAAMAMPAGEIEALLESPVHEVRAGACSIMGQSAKHKRASEARRTELYELYLRRHDRINNWDLVDLAAAPVVGAHLMDRPRDPLYALARSGSWPERRTAIVATTTFIRSGQVDDTYAIAELLLGDDHDLVHKGTGWMLRFAGDVDPDRLRAWLDAHAAAMPRVMLRYAIEHLPPEERKAYRSRTA